MSLKLSRGLFAFSKLWCVRNRLQNPRCLSAINNSVTGHKKFSTNMKFPTFKQYSTMSQELNEFLDYFPVIVNDISNDPRYKDIPEAVNLFKIVLENTVLGGTYVRGISVIRSYKALEDQRNLTSENIKLAYILGWCIELVQAGALVIDDMIDNAKIRRGMPCWYRREDIGRRASLDGMLVMTYAFQLLMKHFSHLPSYMPLTNVLNETIRRCFMGEMVSTVRYCANKGQTIDMYTKERWRALAFYNTAILEVHAAYRLSWCLANKYHTEIQQDTIEIMNRLGVFYKAQNDFLDCYYEPTTVNDSFLSVKAGNDIEDGTCSWLIATALEKANPSQRKILQTHYGKDAPDSVKIVKELYNELKVPKAYAEYEKSIFDLIDRNIEQVSKICCHEMMFKHLDHLYEKYL